jgi:hypothetical protein
VKEPEVQAREVFCSTSRDSAVRVRVDPMKFLFVKVAKCHSSRNRSVPP